MNTTESPEITEQPEQPEQPQSPRDILPSRAELVKEITAWVRDTREFWKDIFDRMRKDMEFAGGDQWEEKKADHDKYVVNFTNRQLNQDLAAVYARNPTVTIERKKRLDHQFWDGSNEQLQQAKMELQAAAQAAAAAASTGQPVPQPPEQAAKIVMDYGAGIARKKLLDKIAETLQLLITFEMDEQKPSFESQMKSLVLREKVTGAGFVGVKFQREYETVQTTTATTSGVLEKMQAIEARVRELQAPGGPGEDAAVNEEVRLMVNSLQAMLNREEAKVLREGVVFDFKPTTSILVDKACRSLHEFVGANRIAELFYLTPQQVMAQYGKDVRLEGTTKYGDDQTELHSSTEAGKPRRLTSSASVEWPAEARCCVAEVYDKRAQLKYVVCDGYPDFLEEPETPWPAVKGFWHIAALKLNRVEVEKNCPKEGITIYGQSSVDLVKPMQLEMNRSQEALKEHRIANRPGFLFPEGSVDKAEAALIGSMPANSGLGLKNVPPGSDLTKIFVPKPTMPLDPALYRTDVVMQHTFLAVGSQSANLGQQNATDKATGQAIAEQSRVTGVSCEVDEEDKFLTEVVRIAGEMLLQAMTLEGVKRKVGLGATWPGQARPMGAEMSPAGVVTLDDCLEQFVIKIEAASSGRANQAVDIQNFKEMWPSLIAVAQAMGLSLAPLLKEQAKILQFKFDLDEWLASAQPLPMMPAGVGPGGPPGAAPPPVQPKPAGTAPDPAGMQARIQKGGAL